METLRLTGIILLSAGLIIAFGGQVVLPMLSLQDVGMTLDYTGFDHYNSAGDYYADIYWYHFTGVLTHDLGGGLAGTREPITGIEFNIEILFRRAPSQEPLPDEFTVCSRITVNPETGYYFASVPMHMQYHNGWHCEVQAKSTGYIWYGMSDETWYMVEGSNAVSDTPSSEPPADTTPEPQIINGFVMDYETNEKIVGATVTVTAIDSLTCVTDENGWFEFTDLEQAVYVLKASAEDYITTTIPNVDVTSENMYGLAVFVSEVGSEDPYMPPNSADDLPTKPVSAGINISSMYSVIVGAIVSVFGVGILLFDWKFKE